MELALIRSLMDKDFYEDHRGDRCPITLFSKDVQKIKMTLDKTMEQFDRSLTPAEVQAVFISDNPTMTTANKSKYHEIFTSIKSETAMGSDVAESVLSKLFQQVIGEEISNLGFDCINGTLKNLQPLYNLLEKYNDDFIPKVTVKWEDISLDTLLEEEQNKYRWKFNLTSLARRIPGVNAGQLIEIGARPNTGKTSFHASLLSGKNGFIEQGASCVVLLNEEKYSRVILRYLNAATNESSETIIKDKKSFYDFWINERRSHLKVADASDRQMSWVESVCKYYNPDILVLDMGDKFAENNTALRSDELLKRNVVYARQIAKKYECCIFYMSQLSAEAEGRVKLDQSMMEGSKTGKAAEADLMLLLAKNPSISDDPTAEQQDPFRYVNVVKNKLNGWHGIITCEFDHTKSIYTA